MARYVLDGSEWFGYVPLTSATSTTAPSFGVVAVWLLMVALWAGASIWLLGLPYTESQHDDPG